MRAYFFTNTWLSGLQKGLQSAHVVADLSQKMLGHPAQDDFIEWVDNHKTIIILEGGAHGDLLEIVEFFKQEPDRYPWTSFCEDEYSLNGAMTSVGIVLPEKIYEWAKGLREGEYERHEAEHKFDEFDLVLIDLLNSHGLAR